MYQNEGTVCISGDFNSRIGYNTDFIEGVDRIPSREVIDKTENHYGDLFVDFLVDSNFCVLNGRIGNENNYTCVSKKGKSVVDYVVVPHESIPSVSDFKVNTISDMIDRYNMDVPDKTPDHSILEWKLAVMNKGPNDEPAFKTQFKEIKRYDMSKLTTEFLNSEDCVKRISETVNRIENELSSNRCINEAYGSFTNFLMNEMDLAGLTVTSPIKYECKSKQSKAKTFLKPYWSDLLQQKWDAASKKEKLWLKCSDHTNIKRKLKQEYCVARNDFDKHLRKAKRTYQNKLQMDLLTELEKPNSRDFWKQIGKIGISNDRRDQIPWEVIDDNGEVTTDKECVLQKWKTDYQTLFNDQTDSMLYDECHLDRIKKGEISSDPELVDTSCLNEPITRCEVEKAVSRLKLRKAAGIDNIPAEVLKNKTCIDMLQNIINFCFENGVSPLEWKQGIINPIVKPNSTDVRLPLSYRGITLLSVPCKVYCDILNSRFGDWIEDSGVLVDEQCGFRRKRSCLDQIYSLYSIINDRIWFSEHVTWNKAVKELSKSASRALSCLTVKFYAYGGMTYQVFTKLYESLVQPILLYGASIWGLTEHRLINNVQNRASKIFLGVTKLTSNTAVQGDLGWLSCHAKQRLEVLRFFYKLENSDNSRTFYKIHLWSKRKRRSWNFNVIKLFRNMSVEHLMQPGISKELFFKVIKSKLRILDEQLWFTKLWNDNSNVNGNKLRLYRRYKKDLQPEHYVTNAMPRHLRSNLCKLRCGTLPLFVTMETASCVKHVIMAANQYKNSKTDGNLVYLQRQLEILVGSLSSRTSTLKFFNLRNLLPVECLNAVIDILRESRDLKPGLLSKCISLFQHLAQDSEIREAFHDSFHLTQCLATVIKTHAGIPGDHLTVEWRTNPITEFTLPCLGLLVNLCRDNFATQSYIKNMEGSRNLYKTLMSYLDDQNLTMMIFTLSCISYLCLHQDIGQNLFNPKNVKWTFQLMFNIVLNGDTGTTRQYAVDLFADLLKNQNIQQSLVEFEKLSSSIEKVLNLVATSTAESVVKIFELLLSLSAVEGIRPIICRCILSTCSVQQRDHYAELAQTPVSQIKEPLFAVVHWASQPAESHDQASLYAIDFLAEFYEEMIYSNTRIQYSAHADLVLPLTLQALSTRIEGESHIMKRISRKIIKALQLCIVLTGEEDIKRKLVGMVDMQMFSKLLEFQFSNNKVALNSSKFTLVTDDLSDIGVEIVMYGLDLMAKLAKNLPEVDALFSSSLQDSRIVPFLSAGLTSDNRTVVQVTLQIICFASMFDAFPTVLLGDALAASNCKRKEELMKRETIQSPVQYHMPVLQSYDNKENINHDASRISIQDATRLADQDASVQSLIDRMQSGFELKGANSSEIIDLYEHKIQSLQTKEEQLQDLLEAKSLALTQADRLIAQHRSRKAAYEAEAAKMRRLLHSSEINSEKCKEEINEIKLKKEHLQNSLENVMEEKSQLEQVAEEHQQLTAAYTELSEKYTSVDKSLLSLKQEHKTLSEMHEVLRKHDENLKEQCDSAAEQLSKLEAERKTLNKTLKEKESKLSELTKTHTKLQKIIRRLRVRESS
ncbi:Hypothetical predicted protein [Mytilus galloprovincialis]|uniref:CIP2A N-terminal domain-containing protein n=1 Tax=Mytilus galloprovincialis TaxID=29158 RepID=A0A8B6DV76_MYTGA|nr:Hypothetical predicted protein [Mytilus galloprovincialis]